MSRKITHALSIRQPWADLIVHGYKSIENRTWRAPREHIGKRFAVHASGKPSDLSAAYRLFVEVCEMDPDDEPCPGPFQHSLRSFQRPTVVGAIIGSVELFDCQDYDAAEIPATAPGYGIPPYHWFEEGFGFLLGNPVVFRNPIPCGGKLNFWKLNQFERAVNEAVAAPTVFKPHLTSQPELT